MNYIIIEMQTNGDTTAVVTPAMYADRNQAESKYHTVMAAAALSSVEKHACVVITEDGRAVPGLSGCYRHPTETAEE